MKRQPRPVRLSRRGSTRVRLQASTERTVSAVVFEIPDMPEAALRTMVAPMCLAQSHAVGLTLALD